MDAYALHRTRVAGADRRILSKRAARAVHDETGGVPRLVNLLLANALFVAAERGEEQIGEDTIRDLAEDRRMSLEAGMPERGGRDMRRVTYQSMLGAPAGAPAGVYVRLGDDAIRTRRKDARTRGRRSPSRSRSAGWLTEALALSGPDIDEGAVMRALVDLGMRARHRLGRDRERQGAARARSASRSWCAAGPRSSRGGPGVGRPRPPRRAPASATPPGG